MTRHDAASDELDDADVARLWSAVWLRARRDARGIGATEDERRDAARWFESSAALDLLLALGVPRDRAARLVAGELEAIRTNGRMKR